ncbi:MAG: protein phosphatase 2C domain-containing protein [Myxococcota bacterium]|nr:protein phosphatase 2C domain-containing protein [Myxococcota bacterium]
MSAAVLHGRDCTAYGIVQRAEHGGWAISLCRGFESPAPKQDPNEDSCGVTTTPSGTVAVVADAHFGRRSAEVAVDVLLSAAQTGPPGRDPIGWMKARLSELNQQLQPGSSACALLMVVAQGDRLFWASIGDCRLYRLRSAQTVVLNRLNERYLGDRGWLRVTTGEGTLQKGDRVIMVSDGVPECRYGIPTLTPQQIGQITAQGSAAEAARALVAAALQGGGEDNIAVALLSHG